MNPTVWSFAPAALLVAMGAAFAWVERRGTEHRRMLPAALREFATNRARRRVRIAALLVFVGALMACGNLTDPREHPIQYVVIWSTTALLAVSMLCYGIADFVASRSLLVERMRRRNASPPVEFREPIRPLDDDSSSLHPPSGN